MTRLPKRPTPIHNGQCEHGMCDWCPQGCFDDPEQIQGIEHDWMEVDGKLVMFTQDKQPESPEQMALSQIMFINAVGNWECRHCHTSALMFTSVGHLPDCPALKTGEQ